MVNILPFKRTGTLISEIDEYIDKVAEAVMVLEQTTLHYAQAGADEQLEERWEQIRAIEDRADALRRGIANVMYSEMLMPDTRGDVLGLLDEVDTTLDDCTHLVAALLIERPEVLPEFNDGFRSIVSEAIKAVQAMLQAARAYFKDPNSVRDHVHRISFHNKEATAIVLRVGKAIFDSDLPLERKRQFTDRIVMVRELASHAEDIGDQVAIFAVKRSY